MKSAVKSAVSTVAKNVVVDSVRRDFLKEGIRMENDILIGQVRSFAENENTKIAYTSSAWNKKYLEERVPLMCAKRDRKSVV